MLLEEEKKREEEETVTFTSSKVVFEGATSIDEFLHKKKKPTKALGDILYVFRIEASGQVWHITKKFKDILKVTSAVSKANQDM